MRRRTQAAALAALLIAWTAGCAYYNTFFHAKEFYNQAVEQEEKAQKQDNANRQQQARGRTHDLYNKCIAKCEKLADNFPTSKWRDDALLLKAKAYYGKSDYLSAKNELLRFITRFPESDLLPEVYFHLGLAHYRGGNYDAAREAWSELSRRFPQADQLKDVNYYLAQSYRDEGNVEQAEAAYEVFIDSQGRSQRAYTARLERAEMRLEAENMDGAREELLVVRQDGRTEQQRLKANLLLAQVMEAEGRLEEALELYWDLAYALDSNYRRGRMPTEERVQIEQKISDEAVSKGVALAVMRERYENNERKMLDKESWEYESLARVLLSEGEVLAKMGRVDEAVLAFQQVMGEYPRTALAAEAQYRIAYAYEVYEENLAEAERAYKLVSTHGRSSFSEDAIRRAGRLNQVKELQAAQQDSTARLDAERAQARFLKAELFLFQQNRPAKAVEEYEAIQRDFAGTDYEGKAALAEAYVRLNIQKDPARGRAALGDVMRKFGDTEYGVYARRVLKGPDPEPEPEEFAGPHLDVLLAEANLAHLALPDTASRGDARTGRDGSRFSSQGLLMDSGHDPGELNLRAVPPGGSSPILNAWQREPRVAQNRLSRGFPSKMGAAGGRP